MKAKLRMKFESGPVLSDFLGLLSDWEQGLLEGVVEL